VRQAAPNGQTEARERRNDLIDFCHEKIRTGVMKGSLSRATIWADQSAAFRHVLMTYAEQSYPTVSASVRASLNGGLVINRL
jgi:hypothetical protein